jgi:HAD superfamily hydrolase (TIGR01549 family)
MIFDKDGTLMELHHYWTTMVELRARMICERLGLEDSHVKKIAFQMGADLDSGSLRPQGPVGLKKREVVMQAAIDYLEGLGLNNMYAPCFEVFTEVDEISSHELRAFVRPIGGAEELVRNASGRGCKIAIATTDRRERAKLAMDFLGFGDVVDMVVGADDVSRPKPNPEQIELILRNFSIDRGQAVMVGDALTDVQMGINAGVKASIGVLTGFATLAQLRTITPYIARDVSEIHIN